MLQEFEGKRGAFKLRALKRNKNNNNKKKKTGGAGAVRVTTLIIIGEGFRKFAAQNLPR